MWTGYAGRVGFIRRVAANQITLGGAITTMADSTTIRSRRDIAYACFLLLGVTALLGSLGSLLPSTLIEPAYFGFFVLIPLTLASAIALIVATVLTFVIGRRDPVLITLLAFTALATAFAIGDFSDRMPVSTDFPVTDLLIVVYGLVALSVCIRWFAVIRLRE